MLLFFSAASRQQDIERLKERLEKRKAEYSGLSENHIAVGVDFRLKVVQTVRCEPILLASSGPSDGGFDQAHFLVRAGVKVQGSTVRHVR